MKGGRRSFATLPWTYLFCGHHDSLCTCTNECNRVNNVSKTGGRRWCNFSSAIPFGKWTTANTAEHLAISDGNHCLTNIHDFVLSNRFALAKISSFSASHHDITVGESGQW